MPQKMFSSFLISIVTLIAINVLFISNGAFAETEAANDEDIVSELGITLKDSLKAEEKNIISYKGRIERVEREKIYLAAAINGYQLQLSTYGNLLLSTGVDISTLQKARSEIKSSMLEIQKMIGEASPVYEAIKLENTNLEQQNQLVQKQITELSKLNSGQKKDIKASDLD